MCSRDLFGRTRLDSVRPPLGSCFRGASALVGLAPAPGSGKKAPRSGALADLPPPLIGRRSRGLSGGLEFLGAKAIAHGSVSCALQSFCAVASVPETMKPMFGGDIARHRRIGSPELPSECTFRLPEEYHATIRAHHTAPDHSTMRHTARATRALAARAAHMHRQKSALRGFCPMGCAKRGCEFGALRPSPAGFMAASA